MDGVLAAADDALAKPVEHLWAEIGARAAAGLSPLQAAMDSGAGSRACVRVSGV